LYTTSPSDSAPLMTGADLQEYEKTTVNATEKTNKIL